MRRSTRPDSAAAWSAGGIAPDPEHGHLSTIRSRAARWNGLPIGSSIPASRNIRICSGRTLAVMAMIGAARRSASLNAIGDLRVRSPGAEP
ncbi:hypothetical protein ASG63_19310 [Methylobacterium sp. Leaf94]|nr:hypothetical protein ASG63_19310 [Methylobacterium sp. Leaf94]